MAKKKTLNIDNEETRMRLRHLAAHLGLDEFKLVDLAVKQLYEDSFEKMLGNMKKLAPMAGKEKSP